MFACCIFHHSKKIPDALTTYLLTGISTLITIMFTSDSAKLNRDFDYIQPYVLETEKKFRNDFDGYNYGTEAIILGLVTHF